MSAPSSTSSHPSSRSGSNPDHDLPTMRELNNLVCDRNFQSLISHMFQHGYQTTSELVHFISLSQTIQRIESNLWDYFIKQEALFINLQDDIRFQLDPSIDTIDKSTLVIAPIHTNNQEDQLAHHL